MAWPRLERLRERRALSSAESAVAPFSLPDLVAERRTNASLRIGVLVYEGVTTTEIDEPVQRLARGLAGDVVHVSHTTDAVVGVEPVRNVQIDASFDDCLRLDVVVIPGGLGWRRLAADEQAMRWLMAVTDRAAGVLAISTGTLLLAAAGRLAGQSATGHWLARDALEDLGAMVSTDRVVHSGDSRLVTASGARAAIDACDGFAERLRWGP